ncbi:hypothetical protein I302_100405 [Kwoniella bestiolae CBS 10118]|uniref:F-box domain-containing protein n=1 Tax=Kwoniella bestiolae CBS 10118 TaxID=1296100 RepID=A0A1B9G517_9TREE|nr:hypothetical protein I302_03780 [Kwoniella bestiolae CBS 10118]OCF26103.1 hypothetical protein I302_03780 [Kwoniella bestiolae CBS 10118]
MMDQSQHFPPEISTHILYHLNADKRTLLNLSLTCKYLHDLATPLLWRYIRLTPWSNRYEKKYYSIFRSTKKKEVLDRQVEEKYQLDGSIGKDNHEWGVYDHVRVLDVEYHKIHWCHSHHPDDPNTHIYQSPKFKNLETLHLRYSHTDWPASFHPGHFTIPCRLLLALRPRVLYIHVKNSDSIQRFHLPDNILHNIQELVLVVGPRLYAMPEGKCEFEQPVLKAFQKIRKMTIIIDPSEPTPNMVGLMEMNDPSLFNASFLASIILNVNGECEVDIVNAGYIEKIRDRRVGLSMEELHRESVDVIKKSLTISREWSWAEIERRKGNLKFWRMEEWVDRCEWVGSANAQEVMEWRDVICKV